MNNKNVTLKFKPPAKRLCMTYTDTDNKMVKIHYNNDGKSTMEIVQLEPEDDRNHISCIMEYEDGTIFTTKTDENGNTNVEVNKPVIYNPETGELEVDKRKI